MFASRAKTGRHMLNFEWQIPYGITVLCSSRVHESANIIDGKKRIVYACRLQPCKKIQFAWMKKTVD